MAKGEISCNYCGIGSGTTKPADAVNWIALCR